MFTDFDFDVIERSLPFLWEGMVFSLSLTGLAMLGGIVLGTVLALMRLSGQEYVDVYASSVKERLASAKTAGRKTSKKAERIAVMPVAGRAWAAGPRQ